MSRRRVRGLGVPALVAFALTSCTAGVAPARSATSSAPTTRAASVTPAVTQDRLTIAALRARAYTASVLTPVRSDGDAGGYTDTVDSFVVDGLTEYALVATPDTARPVAGWPAIVLNHGYSNPATYVTDTSYYAQFIATFARAGYLVVQPDYRGYGHSQGVPEGGHFSPVYAYDLLTLIATLRADPAVNPSRIGLFAHSMGGHEALRALVVTSDVRAAVFMAGVVGSFYDIFYNWPNSPVTSDVPAVVQQIRLAEISAHGTPQTDPSFWASVSAIDYVSSVTAAVQVNQDLGDSVVPATFAQHLVAALQAAGKTVQYLTYPGDDHQFSRNRAAILANALGFFRAQL